MAFLLTILGAAGISTGVTLALDPETARLLNTLVNFATLFLLYRHRREVKPKVENVEEKVNHLDDSLGAARPGGRRAIDPPADTGAHHQGT